MKHLGIDLSKKYFDATLQSEEGNQSYGRFENEKSGYAKLKKWLKKRKVDELHACMEATNVYWEELADYLYEQGYQVSVVNPARIKGFGMSQMQRNKTDKVDSKVIVAFCAALSPKLWHPPSEAQRKLRSLVRHREGLIKSRTQQKNRLADCRDEVVRASLKKLIDLLNAEIAQMEEQISHYIQQEPELREQKELLLSIKGIGPAVAHILMAEMYDLAEYENAHAAAADAGLTPSHHESGETIRKKPKLSKIGKASVRGILYMPAFVAKRFNPIIQRFALRLEARGKPTKVVAGAIMRKLIHIAYGVLKHKTPFDPNFDQHSTTATA